MKPKTLEMDGLTSFRSRPNASYRFILTLKEDKLNVWLEDRKSKKQWQSGFLGLDAFVTSENAIPGAKLAEYANCFKRALEKADDDKDALVERELRDDKSEGLKLEFVVHIKVFETLWSPAYSLTLKPISIERVDILESRLFDVEQEVVRCSNMEFPSASATLSEFTTANCTTSGRCATWSTVSGADFAVESNGCVRALVGGTFVVAVEIPYFSTSDNASVALVKEGLEMGRQSVWHFRGEYDSYGRYCNSHVNGTTAVTWVEQLKIGQKLSIKAKNFRMEASAKMVIAKLAASES